jgi:hypothetical protein
MPHGFRLEPFLCVGDRGVGRTRPAIVLEADGRWYVGPGNGLFELVQRRATKSRSWDIDYRPEHLSASFHGRDLFAPVAAMLANGEPPRGQPRTDGADRRADWPDDLREIVCVDHFGDAMMGLRGRAASQHKACRGRSCIGTPEDLQRWAARRGLLVREFERARRDSGQPGARRPRSWSRDRHSGRDRLLKESGTEFSGDKSRIVEWASQAAATS